MMSQDNRLLPVTPVERGLDRPLAGDVQMPQVVKSGYGAAAEPTHLREYLNVVLKRKWLILSLVLVVTTLVAIQMYRMPSIYEAQTTIQIDPKKESILRTGKDQIVINTGRDGSDPTYWQTQLRLLENRAVAPQVILTLDLQNIASFRGGQGQTGVVDSIRRVFTRERRPAAEKPVESGLGEADPV